jgi:signal transduction histidine kinase
VQQRTQELSQANADLQTEHEALVASMERLELTRSMLLQSEKMAAVGQLAAGVAHEVNNPIGFVSSNIGSLGGYVEQLFELTDVYRQASTDLPAAQRQAIDAALKKIDLDYLRQDVIDLLRESKEGLSRVKRIVSDLLDVVHVDDDQALPVDLNQVLEAALNVMATEITLKAEVVKKLAAVPPVLCQASQIQQAFVNLLVNAIQAIPDRGRITVRSGCAADGVWAEISDDGCGMSEEVQRRIFEPFYTTKPVGTGIGLGLSQAWEIVQRHHGKIQVKSTPGHGATFRVSLPPQAAQPVV